MQAISIKEQFPSEYRQYLPPNHFQIINEIYNKEKEPFGIEHKIFDHLLKSTMVIVLTFESYPISTYSNSLF